MTRDDDFTAKVLWHTMMSLDGFIAGPDDTMDWVADAAGPARFVDEIVAATGAIVGGRRWYDVATERYGGRHGIYGGRWEGAIVVLTNRPEEGAEDEPDPAFTFVSGGIEQAVGTAREAAPGRAVGLFGADVARQALEAGLVDEIVVHVAPVLLGDGVRLYGGGAPRVQLVRIAGDVEGQVTDLRFRVER